MNVKRIYVEEESEHTVKTNELKSKTASYLGISTVSDVRVLIRYDIESLSKATCEASRGTVLSEPPVDTLYEKILPREEGDMVLSVEYLPGQFDQRADSAEQYVRPLKEDGEPVIQSATTYVMHGDVTPEQVKAIRSFCINPVDSRETGNAKPETLMTVFETPAGVVVFNGFQHFEREKLLELYQPLNLAMTFKDFQYIQNYFMTEERRDPSMTEIRVPDTYWSDRCCHTTFQTKLKNVTFTEGDYEAPIKETCEQYLADREIIYKGRGDKFVCLMDLALMAMKKLRSKGRLEDSEVSDEINTCSIVVPVGISGVEEEWLVSFKNETHNRPAKIEPFGGTTTCLGGAIRDPLSGRTYVYQAMRITGAADPTESLEETPHGKLPQRKVVAGAANRYSFYGNQIGLATGYIKETYHSNYVARRMKIGAVMDTVPRRSVIRETSNPGDVIILLGGRTGRGDCSGTAGSSRVHAEESIETCGTEVQKRNAPTEREIQRLFRRGEANKIIKKCSGFRTGSVSTAIGELAGSLAIDLDKVPKKYTGLDKTEIAISESQERMAVIIDPKDVSTFLAYTAEENLEAVAVAVVTEGPCLVMNWRGKNIMDISRAFPDTSDARQEANVVLEAPAKEGNPLDRSEVGDVKKTWPNMLKGPDVRSQKGLVEMFDGSVGTSNVFMPYGGEYRLAETQSMVAKLPVLEGKADTVAVMSYGFDPYLSSWNPYHETIYTVLSSMAEVVAAGGDYSKVRFTFQEYFRQMTGEASRWSQSFATLLGAYNARLGFGLPSIGGKGSMSETFNEIDMPPTLVSFAMDIASHKYVITPEFKKPGSRLVVLQIERNNYDLPVYGRIIDGYAKLHEDIKAGRIISAYAVKDHDMTEAVSKMTLGNKLGAETEHNVDKRDFFGAGWGNIVCEVPDGKMGELSVTYTVTGEVTDTGLLEHADIAITMDEALGAWIGTLEDVFPTKFGVKQTTVANDCYEAKNVYICKHQAAQPNVFVSVFPGTNCEYDNARAFEQAGASAITKIFKNLSAEDIRESVECFRKEVSQAQIIIFPGGFSAGNEPEGSAKLFATVFRNQVVKGGIETLLSKRDGPILGICSGPQALIKLGLLPEDAVAQQRPDFPTLAMSTVGHHISKMVYTKVVSNGSPWLAGAELDGVYCNPTSHGEGWFVASDEWLNRLFENGRVATQYVDGNGVPTMDELWDPDGSYMTIEDITSPDGRTLGRMAHSERRDEAVAMNIYGEQDLKIFESDVKYFK